ncbi:MULTISPECIES: hypothetical protein [unclassified Actinomyces]|uniref:hypothetical protein n=1 Tax=unclassified Actinomyces TaxID=2609248 RepID=UPI0013A700F2|nr:MULTISPECIES: hypothetical protein [unclassified Actinomyces]MBW3068840.1 hypothetical protein [Actinomyces sp. 594]NDR52611.1 hypothetical protein [Actinomyces sp. 565]
MRTFTSLAAAFAVALCFQAVTTSAVAADDVSGPDDVGVNVVDEFGQRLWYGSESSTVAALANRAEEFAESHPDTVLGVALTSDRQVVEVFVTSLDIAGLDELLSADSTHIRAVVNENSPEQIRAAEEQVLNRDWGALHIESVAPDPIGDGIEVTISEGDHPADSRQDGNQSDFDDLEDSVLDSLGDIGVGVRVTPGEPEVEAKTRFNDSSYFYAGGAIVLSNGTRCSLGAPIEIGGKYYVLTAGHCGKGTWRNGGNGNFVGSLYTTTWTGTAHKYGDWQLLRGSHYALRVFNAQLNSSSSLPISGGDFGRRALGRELCASGSTTGATCRYVVRSTNSTRKVGSTTVGHLTNAIHDVNRDGVADCNGFRAGDSGGISYYGDGRGGATAYGIVTGLTTGSCSYSFTQLSGVRAWNGKAKVG